MIKFLLNCLIIKWKRYNTSDKDEPIDVCINRQCLQSTNILDNIYTKSVIVKGELSSSLTQVAAGNNNGKLQSACKNFLNILKRSNEQQNVSAKPKQKLN